MTIKLNSIILPDNITNKMKALLEKTKNSRLEHGFDVCCDKNNDLVIRNECRGTLCSIDLPQLCEKEERLVGDFHTHPRGPSIMSDTDMYDACGLDFSCVGSSFFGQDRITCLIRKPDVNTIDCQKDVFPEGKTDTRRFISNYSRLRGKYFRKIDIL